jgi:hypothetical protein
VWNTASWNLQQQSQKICNNVFKNYDETWKLRKGNLGKESWHEVSKLSQLGCMGSLLVNQLEEKWTWETNSLDETRGVGGRTSNN